jgi:ABC-type multidrug transport system ATPase subunit
MLDEPTSGLDSFTSLRLVRTLHNLAREKGKTIVATIHQPSSAAFSYIDKLFLMAEGKIIYQGRAKKAQDYF